MLTTRGTNNVSIEVWTASTDSIQRVGPLGVQIDAKIDPSGQPMEWVDSTTLLAAFVPPGTLPIYYMYGPIQRFPRGAAWARTEHGARASVNVLEGGIATPESARPQGSLAIIDLRTGRSRAILRANVREVALSPGHRRVAVIADDGNVVFGPDEAPRWPDDEAFVRLSMHRRLGLASLDSADGVRWVAGLHDPYISQPTASWAPDGSKLVVGAHTSISQASAVKHVVISAEGQAIGTTSDSTSVPSATSQSKPAPDSGLTAIAEAPSTGFALYMSEPANGSLIWTRETRRARPRVRLRINQHLGSVEDDVGTERLIHYRGANGIRYTARVILPAGYSVGARYPTIVWVYPGYVVPDSPVRRASSKPHSAFNAMMNPYLWSTKGFVVLQPSIAQSHGDPILSLAGYVDPAIDSLIATGITDSTRLGLIGHSHGGVAVYGLVSTTTRYRAAIAIGGWSDIQSYYSSFLASYCYCSADYPNEWAATGMLQFEATNKADLQAQALWIGATPWADPASWYRNNPIEHFDRVSTPIMIVKGDHDFFYMSDGDIAFQALHRLGKRVRYVRYWGEGHSLSSPSNIRDYWARAAAWFDEFVSRRAGSASSERAQSTGTAGAIEPAPASQR